jgi:PAS domain S-box-containing protein
VGKIVFNLLSNAFKFTLEGGISLRIGTFNGMAQLVVSDTGVGIPDEALPHLFERFHRIEESRGRSHEGTGIGLALVRELVRLHGGTIDVASSPGVGTTFTIRIPFGRHHLPAAQVGVERAQSTSAARAQTFVEEALRWLPEESSAGSAVPAGIARPRIVLADDNADMRQYIQRILSEQYDVVTVADGEAALAQIELQRPDLVLSDVMMPRLDGFGLLKALKTAPETSDLPVILLSARAGDEAEIEGLDAGADAYLIKPFQARELKARVRSLLAKDEARREQENHFRMVADKAPIILWTTDAEGACTYLSQHWYDFTGGTRTQDLGFDWMERIHPLDQDTTKATFIKSIREQAPFRLEYRLRGRSGHYSWMIDAGTPRFDEAGRFVGHVGCVFDIAERRQMEAILDAQKRSLELSVGGAPLRQILEVFVQGVEMQSSAGARASILLVDESGERLTCGGAPSLPQALHDAFEGLVTGPDSAICGTVARLRKPLLVGDVQTDPRCAPYREIASAHAIRSCWSTPVFSTEGVLLAVITLYYPTP